MTKSRLFLRIVAGGYLAYLGVGLIKDVLTDKPENTVLYMAIAVAFAVIGLYVCVKGVLAAVRHEYIDPADEADELDKEELLQADEEENEADKSAEIMEEKEEE